MRKSEIIVLIIIFLSFAIGIYFNPKMPEKMASHWNIYGQVDDYLPKFWGLFLMPIISFLMFILFLVIPKIDPLKQNIEKFRKYFDWFIALIVSFLFYLYVLTIFWNLGFEFNFVLLLTPAFSLLFYCIGVLIENAKQNWFIGIRTPWTLSSEKVWDKTHKIGAKLFKITAVIGALGILFPGYAFFFIFIPVISVSIYIVIYSFLEYRKI